LLVLLLRGLAWTFSSRSNGEGLLDMFESSRRHILTAYCADSCVIRARASKTCACEELLHCLLSHGSASTSANSKLERSTAPKSSNRQWCRPSWSVLKGLKFDQRSANLVTDLEYVQAKENSVTVFQQNRGMH
jgi:hypothetical protein